MCHEIVQIISNSSFIDSPRFFSIIFQSFCLDEKY